MRGSGSKSGSATLPFFLCVMYPAILFLTPLLSTFVYSSTNFLFSSKSSVHSATSFNSCFASFFTYVGLTVPNVTHSFPPLLFHSPLRPPSLSLLLPFLSRHLRLSSEILHPPSARLCQSLLI
nr:hypothetical protein GZ26D8_13 [uncultured archaeon GZfos26D8]